MGKHGINRTRHVPMVYMRTRNTTNRNSNKHRHNHKRKHALPKPPIRRHRHNNSPLSDSIPHVTNNLRGNKKEAHAIMRKKKPVLIPIKGFIIDGQTAQGLGRNKNLKNLRKKNKKEIFYIARDERMRDSIIAYDIYQADKLEKELKKYLKF